MNTPDQPQPLSLAEAIVPVASLILLVALSYFLFGDAGAAGPNQVALVVATMIAVFIGWRRGHSLKSLGEAAAASVSSGIGAIFILFAVGALIGTWAMSGTLVAMVYYGLQLLSPNYFFVTACAICGIVSASIGSSWTVVGTIGIGFMGIAANMGLNPAIAAGAIISGAYFGDKSSPLSDSANLAAAAAGVDLYQHVRETLLTSLVAMAIALAVFFMLGRPGDFDASAKIAAIEGAFNISPLLFLPLVLVVVLAAFKFPPFTAIFLGALAGGLLAVFMAPARVIAFADPEGGLPAALALFKGVWLALASGYKSSTGIASIDMLASRGGMDSMLNTIWLIITALAFGGVVEKAGVLDRLITPIIEKAKSDGALVASLVSSIIATNIITADQYIAIVLPGRMFKGAFERRGLAPVVLSRAVGDSATTTSSLIPWNSCGAYMAATLGVATWHYAPFAIFCIVSPLLTIAIAYAGIRMLRIPATSAQAAARTHRAPAHDDCCCAAVPQRRKCANHRKGVASCLRTRPPGPHRRSQRATALLALATLALLSACNRAAEAPQPEVRPVRVITIEKRAGGDSIALTGTVQAQTEINLSFRIDGRMLERNVNVGDAVRPGQLVARLDSQNEESSLQAAQAQLVAARARLTEARNNFARFRDLVAENAVSRASFEQAESAMKSAESQVETAQSQVTLGENRLSYTRLVSDVAGVVTAQGAEPGEVVGAGRMIVQVAREGMRDAVFDVPARVKDAVTSNAGDDGHADLRSEGHRQRRRARSRAARRPGHRHLQGQVSPRQSAGGHAARQHGDGAHEARRRAEHRDPAVRGEPVRPADRRVGRRSEDRHGRDRATSKSARPIRSGSRSRPASIRETSS